MPERRFALMRFEAALKRSLIEALDALGDDLRQSADCAELLEDHANHLLTLSYEISEEHSAERRAASMGRARRQRE